MKNQVAIIVSGLFLIYKTACAFTPDEAIKELRPEKYTALASHEKLQLTYLPKKILAKSKILQKKEPELLALDTEHKEILPQPQCFEDYKLLEQQSLSCHKDLKDFTWQLIQEKTRSLRDHGHLLNQVNMCRKFSQEIKAEKTSCAKKLQEAETSLKLLSKKYSELLNNLDAYEVFFKACLGENYIPLKAHRKSVEDLDEKSFKETFAELKRLREIEINKVEASAKAFQKLQQQETDKTITVFLGFTLGAVLGVYYHDQSPENHRVPLFFFLLSGLGLGGLVTNIALLLFPT